MTIQYKPQFVMRGCKCCSNCISDPSEHHFFHLFNDMLPKMNSDFETIETR